MTPIQRVNALMIDDDPESLLLMGIRLNEACGPDLRFSLEGAETLKAGLLRIETGGYDVILLDLNLPDSRGLDTVAAACAKAGGTPVVVMTCFEDESVGLEAIGLGAQDYLIKDRLNMTLLGRSIRFAIERSALLRELRELEQLRAEVRERRKADQFKDRLLGAVSHELRSPLTVAQAAVSSLAEGLVGPLSPGQAELVEMAGRNLDRLGRLVMNALDYSRLDSGRASLEFRRVDARRLISELASDWKRALAKPLSVEVDLPDGLPAVRADADHFAQLLGNLLDNAARHAAGRVRVCARAEGGMVRVTVEDDGPGVPRALSEEIFVPYMQLTRGKGPGYKGTGLGLAICREIAELSSGRVWLDETAEAGARFHFELPRWTPAALAAAK
ncbi:MAG: hybrid sensor histidine kinase/response regulator [Elusimicrobia bacterium]|nr:hybrid sensor histidine kinase/response regulator [Elusimicrobiota bacterium]